MKWYLMAAAQGDAYAEYSVGYMYYFGLGVARNEAEADKWFTKASEDGSPEADDALLTYYVPF